MRLRTKEKSQTKCLLLVEEGRGDLFAVLSIYLASGERKRADLSAFHRPRRRLCPSFVIGCCLLFDHHPLWNNRTFSMLRVTNTLLLWYTRLFFLLLMPSNSAVDVETCTSAAAVNNNSIAVQLMNHSVKKRQSGFWFWRSHFPRSILIPPTLIRYTLILHFISKSFAGKLC